MKLLNTMVESYKDDAGDLLKGSPGTSVDVTFKRQGKTQIATINRAEVAINAVPYFSMINDKTGYIVLSQFSEKATSQTNYAVRDLKAQGAKRLILDLRGNPGGLVNEAIDVVNIFVPKGQLVVTTKSKVKKYNRTYYTQRDPIDTNIPLVILIDGGSASASEIVSGSLQDLDRAVIVGSRSFGKGLVQRPKLLTYGTQIKITISRYYTPSGRCIQALDYWHKNEKGEAVRVKQENYNEYKTKNGRKVFDGGGIFPDEVMSGSKNTALTSAIVNDYLIFDYATDFYYKHKNYNIDTFKLTDSDFTNFKSFLKANQFSFETNTEKALKSVLEAAKKEAFDDDIKNNYNTLATNLSQSKIKALDENKDYLLDLLTEEIVKRYAYREGLYDYFKTHDPEIRKATNILSSPSAYLEYLR